MYIYCIMCYIYVLFTCIVSNYIYIYIYIGIQDKIKLTHLSY